MSTLKDQLIKLGFNPTEEAAEPAWGRGRPQVQGSDKRGSDKRGSDKRGSADRGGRDAQRRGGRQGRQEQRKPKPSFKVPADPQERHEAIQKLLKRARRPLPAPGPKRFYFQSGQSVDFIEVDHEGFKQLSSGQLGLTLDDSGRLIALEGEALLELEALRAAQ